jgi:hypothetical protein
MMARTKADRGEQDYTPPLILTITVDRNTGRLALASTVGESGEAAEDIEKLISALQVIGGQLTDSLVNIRVAQAQREQEN